MSVTEADASMTTTTTTTTITGPLAAGSSPVSMAQGLEDEDDPSTLTGSGDMDLVNGPNPWLPAYGFQLQHHSHFQPSHEDLRANETALVQQVDFLETILEETSDDLQSDSDRSGTTYWLSSDSETESVIHIRAKQRSADGSGSECNSVVPKKRRRRNNGTSDQDHQPAFDDYPGSPRSSRSTASSRSSSLLQFESLERTCATLSPSTYSFDSLEYSNRSNASHPENTSPDSLEQDYDHTVPNGYPENDRYTRIRPYRSFESLDTCQKEDEFGQTALTNGFAPLYLKRNHDLSRSGRSRPQPRDFWHEEEEYEDDKEEDLDEEDRILAENRSGFEERLMVFGDSTCNYATSLDYRNTIDLREIGIETKKDALLELKSESSSLRLLQARLSITGGMAHGRNVVSDHHHHHQHHNHQQTELQQQEQQYQHHEQPHQHGYEQHREQRQHQQHRHRQGWSKEECFNFRFTDKSQSAPSLPSSVDESAYSPRSLAARSNSRTTSFVSTSNLFENYTRVASVPVDLNLCGISDIQYEPEVRPSEHEMVDVSGINEKKRLESLEENGLWNGGEEVEEEEEDVVEQAKASLTSSVRTQAPQGVLIDGKINHEEKMEAKGEEQECVDGHCEPPREKKQVTSTVKTQDRNNCVLDMAMAMENDIDAVVDEAIKQFKREVEEATVGSDALEGIQRTASGKQRPRRVKNNASYELAQQFEIDERNFRSNRYRTRREHANEEKSPESHRSGVRKRVFNNASYELAQQCDYINALTSSRGAFHRMDACDELEEPTSRRSSRLIVSDIVQQKSSSSASNLTSHYVEELQTRRYSKSTENVSGPFSGGSYTKVPLSQLRPKQEEEDESLLGQIKKNSDPFSIYGDDASTPPFVDDEVDYPCLETKPIGASSLEGGGRPREDESRKTAQNLETLPQDSSHRISDRESDQDQVERSLIGGDSPETTQRDKKTACPVQEDSFRAEECPRNPSSGRNAGERRRSVVVEATEKEDLAKEVTVKEESKEKEEKEKEKEKEEATAVAAEAAVAAARGQSVHGVRGSPPKSNSSSSKSGGLELGERSGNPAVAVAVDTNHRADRDKRHEENAPATTARKDEPRMSTTVKQPLAAIPANKDPSPRFQRNVDGPAKEERKKGGLGGFLQRFSRLRFSGRSKVPRSEVQKKSDTLSQVNRAKVTEGERKKEPDYIIIPLHPPEEEKRKDELVTLEARTETDARSNADVHRSNLSVSSNGRAPVSSKPPLPPQPPRAGALRPSTAASAAASSTSRRRAATDLGNPAAIEMAKARTMQAAQERPVGLLETDLDEAVSSTTASSVAQNAHGKKTRSLLNLNHTSVGPRPRPENALHVPQSPVAASHRNPRDDGTTSTINQRPHKSMEFLLDKENLHFVKPPENELQKVGERIPSEHELRVQRSLQRLNVPDWYKNSPAARDGFRLKRHSDASQHGGWRALGSKTTSLSSLSSSSNRQPTTGALLSPSPTPPVFSRWSTSLLNSAGSSPASSARSSFNHRQPYLGWRSQERLTNPRTPAERLAQGILPQLQAANKQQQQQQQQQQQTTNQQLEVRNSIKEVTSAIVHYVQSGQEVVGGGRLSPRPRPEDWDDRGGARSTSPRGSVKLCWMESSFVGTRPVDSPETPMSLATETDCCNATGTESCSCIDSATSGLFLDLTPTRDDAHHQQQQQQHQMAGTGSLCPSPSSSMNFHQQQHHHRQPHHQQQQQQQQQRHHRGELLLA